MPHSNATSASPPPTPPLLDPDRVLRVALVGAGYWGSRILRNLLTSDSRVRVGWVCDRDPARWSAVRELDAAMPCTDRLSDVLADPEVEAVLVAIPPRDHVELGLEVLRAGKHLFIEKPMALSVVDAERLIEEARRHERRLMVGLTYRYNDGVERVAELVQSGALGAVRAVHSQRSSRKTTARHTNVLWSLAPHDVSMLMHVLGGEPFEVRAEEAGAAAGAGAEEATLDLSFAGDVAARVFVSWLAGPKTRRMMVVGEQKTVVFDEAPDRPLLAIYPTPPLAPSAHDLDALFAAIARIPEGAAEVLAPRNGMHEPLRAECDHFLDCVRHDLSPRTDGEVGLSVTRVLAALQRSMDEGGRSLELNARPKAVPTGS